VFITNIKILFTVSLNANVSDSEIVVHKARSTKKSFVCFNLATGFAMTFFYIVDYSFNAVNIASGIVRTTTKTYAPFVEIINVNDK